MAARKVIATTASFMLFGHIDKNAREFTTIISQRHFIDNRSNSGKTTNQSACSDSIDQKMIVGQSKIAHSSLQEFPHSRILERVSSKVDSIGSTQISELDRLTKTHERDIRFVNCAETQVSIGCDVTGTRTKLLM